MFSECPSLLSANEAMEKDVSRADLSSKLFDNKENSKENLKYVSNVHEECTLHVTADIPPQNPSSLLLDV